MRSARAVADGLVDEVDNDFYDEDLAAARGAIQQAREDGALWMRENILSGLRAMASGVLTEQQVTAVLRACDRVKQADPADVRKVAP